MVLELKFAGENDQMSLKNLWLHALLCVCVCVCVFVCMCGCMAEYCVGEIKAGGPHKGLHWNITHLF